MKRFIIIRGTVLKIVKKDLEIVSTYINVGMRGGELLINVIMLKLFRPLLFSYILIVKSFLYARKKRKNLLKPLLALKRFWLFPSVFTLVNLVLLLYQHKILVMGYMVLCLDLKSILIPS